MRNNINIDEFDTIKDSEMRVALFDFFNTKDLVSNMAIQCKYHYIAFFENVKLNNLTRLTFCDIWDTLKTQAFNKKILAKLHINFLGFLLKNNLYKGTDLEEMIPFTSLLCTSDSNATANCVEFFDKKRSINSFFVFTYEATGGVKDIDIETGKRTKRIYHRLVYIDCENTFIVSLLNDFFNNDSMSSKSRVLNFALLFLESDKNIKNFLTISDFTYKVFKNQFKYFKNKPHELKELIKFYIYLSELSGSVNFFKPIDPIDTNMLKRTDFIKLFKEGYVLVNYNTFEECPSYDKWLLKPNGLESTSTITRDTTYLKIDFSDIKNEIYKPYLKQYYWEKKENIYGKKQRIQRIIDFLDFLTDYKSNSIETKKNSIDFKSITAVEVYSYRGYIETSSIGASTKNGYYGAVRDFLDFCINKKYLSVQSGAFEYLGGVTRASADGGTDIPDDELVKLEEQLRKRSNDSLINGLYYIMFHLAIETEFRISQIASLRISEIKEGMKKNQFFIYSINKSSNADKEIQHITLYAKRHLDMAIKLTENLREMASPDVKDYIFLMERNNTVTKDITPIGRTAFTRYLKKNCREIGIKEYNVSNLRDTHMTKAVEYGFKQGLSPIQIGTLTNHVKTSTTNNNYVNYKVRTFAEATFGITIGDVDIKGTILNTTSEEENFKKEDTVDNGCGFCKENACKIKSELGCPMCDGFVVTLDRIPFYEQRIKEIDAMIENEPILHEREHLHTIKRLYVAYLERLYTLLEEEAN